jgi:hypothetical protein
VTFPSKEESLKYSLLELDERKKEFEKKFNFSFPLPFACLYDESLYPPSYESPPTSSAHIGVQMIVNAVTNGDILRFLRNDLLVKQFFPDQELFYDLKGMVRQGPIYNTSDELYDRMLVCSCSLYYFSSSILLFLSIDLLIFHYRSNRSPVQ